MKSKWIAVLTLAMLLLVGGTLGTQAGSIFNTDFHPPGLERLGGILDRLDGKLPDLDLESLIGNHRFNEGRIEILPIEIPKIIETVVIDLVIDDPLVVVVPDGGSSLALLGLALLVLGWASRFKLAA